MSFAAVSADSKEMTCWMRGETALVLLLLLEPVNLGEADEPARMMCGASGMVSELSGVVGVLEGRVA
jgi:hypothetical protein